MYVINAQLQKKVLDSYQSRYNLPNPQVSVLPDTTISRNRGSLEIP